MVALKLFLAAILVVGANSQLSTSKNPDGSPNLNAKIPFAGNDNNEFSALGGLSGAKNGGYASATGGLAWDNVNGHGASLTGSHIPNVADQLSVNGRMNLLNTDNHNANVNAFATRTMPDNSQLPDFNTYGGSFDYMYKNKVGASIGAVHTPLFQKTDYSAMGNLNLFRDKSSSLDLNAGLSKSVSPFIPKSSWEPSASFTYSRNF